MSSSPSKSSEFVMESPVDGEELGVAGLATAEPTTAAEIAAAPQPRLYRVVWRWHFYAGLIVAPFFLIAAITGAIYVFQAELSGWLYSDLHFVEPTGTRLSYDEQQAIALEAAGGMELEYITVRTDPRRSTVFITHVLAGGDETPGQMHRCIFIDPYSGKVLGTQILEREFFHVVLQLHRSLFMGATGRIIVELATSWGLVLLVTGVYLWWPRAANRIRGVWLPRLRGKLYVVLRDLHAVCGFYTAVFAAIILATGLFMSQVWGTGFTLASIQVGQSLGEFFARGESQPLSTGESSASLDRVVKSVQEYAQPGDVLAFMPATNPQETHKAYLMHQGDVNTVRGVDIDQNTGKVAKFTETAELEPMVRLLALAESLHQGLTFGMASKIVAFVTCLVLIGMVVTGVWMWWDRRPAGETGFPQRPNRGRMPRWLLGLIVLFGILLPTVGVSTLLIIGGDWVLQRLRQRRATI